MFFNRIIRILKRHLQNYLTYYLILTVILVIGIILGPLIMDLFDSATRVFIVRYSNPYYKMVLLEDYQQHSVFKSSIFTNVFMILFLVFASAINIGLFIVPIIVLIKGISIGFTVGFLVSNFGLKGFLVSIGGIYLQNIFIIYGLIGLGAISMAMTDRYGNTISSTRLSFHNRNLNESILLAGVYSTIILFGSIIEGYLSPKFLGLTLDFFL